MYKRQKKVSETEAELGDPALDELLTPYLHQQLVDEIELLDLSLIHI